MLNEKLDEAADWKGSLRELDSLPGELPLNKGLAWERLDQRLQGNRFRLQPSWYWIAAAVIIAMMIIPLRSHKMPSVVVKSGLPVHKDPAFVTLPQQRPVIKQTDLTNAVAAKKQPGQQYLTNSRLPTKGVKEQDHSNSAEDISIRSNKGKDPQTIPGKMPADSAGTMTIAPNNFTTDTAKSMALAPAVKKKLRVIHINQLGQPVEETFKESRYAGRPLPYRRFSNQNSLYNSPAPISTFTEDLLKIKITPQN